MKLVATCPNCDNDKVEVKNGERSVHCNNCGVVFTTLEDQLREIKEGGELKELQEVLLKVSRRAEDDDELNEKLAELDIFSRSLDEILVDLKKEVK